MQSLLFRLGLFSILLLSLATRLPAAAPIDFAAEAKSPSLKNFDLGAWLRADKFIELEQKLAVLAKETKRDDDYMLPIYHIYQWSDGAPDLEPHLLAYTKAFPDSYIAHLLLAQFYSQSAWAMRGYGRGPTMLEEQEKIYVERMHKAFEALMHSIKLNDNNPEAFSEMLNVMNQMAPRNDDYAETLFKNAIRSDPTYFNAYLRYLAYLSPYWGGSMGKFLNFANDCASNPPPKSLVSLIYIEAHVALATDNDHEMQKPAVWAETKRIYGDLVKRFPKSRFLDWYAFRASQNDPALAVQLFTRIGVNWSADVWDSANEFLKSWGDSYTPPRDRKQMATQILEQVKQTPLRTRWEQANYALLRMLAGGPYEKYASTVKPMLIEFDWNQAEMLINHLNPRDIADVACIYSDLHPYQIKPARRAAYALSHMTGNYYRQAEVYARRVCALNSFPEDVAVLCEQLNGQGKCTETLQLVTEHLRFKPEELLRATPQEIKNLYEWHNLDNHIELLKLRAEAARNLNMRELTYATWEVLAHIAPTDPEPLLHLAYLHARKDSGYYDAKLAEQQATQAEMLSSSGRYINERIKAQFIQSMAHAEQGRTTLSNDQYDTSGSLATYYFFKTREELSWYYPEVYAKATPQPKPVSTRAETPLPIPFIKAPEARTFSR